MRVCRLVVQSCCRLRPRLDAATGASTQRKAFLRLHNVCALTSPARAASGLTVLCANFMLGFAKFRLRLPTSSLCHGPKRRAFAKQSLLYQRFPSCNACTLQLSCELCVCACRGATPAHSKSGMLCAENTVDTLLKDVGELLQPLRMQVKQFTHFVRARVSFRAVAL